MPRNGVCRWGNECRDYWAQLSTNNVEMMYENNLTNEAVEVALRQRGNRRRCSKTTGSSRDCCHRIIVISIVVPQNVVRRFQRAIGVNSAAWVRHAEENNKMNVGQLTSFCLYLYVCAISFGYHIGRPVSPPRENNHRSCMV